MKTSTAEKRKAEPALFKNSALESARQAGVVGAFDGPANLAANRKKYAREKSRGKARSSR
jgi:hypothetical protein